MSGSVRSFFCAVRLWSRWWADEPGEQGAVFGGDGVVFARVEVGDLCAGLAVVAVVAFADVVKEGGKVEDGRVFQAGQGFGGFGVGGVGTDEAVEGFDEFEGVLVHGVLVEEVVLHASGDVGEGGDVAVEQAVFGGCAPVVVDGTGTGEQGEEGAAVCRRSRRRADVGSAQCVRDGCGARGRDAVRGWSGLL